MGSVGGAGNNAAYTYEWLEEDWLASWLGDEQVVEAVLGDPDPSGTDRANGASSRGDGADDQVSFDTARFGCVIRFRFGCRAMERFRKTGDGGWIVWCHVQVVVNFCRIEQRLL